MMNEATVAKDGRAGLHGHDGEVLLIDKPKEWTSFDVVRRIRWSLNVRKAGHAGALDPKATGLLIVCTEGQTKEIASFMHLEKEYEGTFELGIETPSHDEETEIIMRNSYATVTRETLEQVIASFVGKQHQTPPMYSAVKYKGKPLYRYARKGKTVERRAKEIEVKEFVVTEFSSPQVAFRIVCSKGTYIRALVRDVGRRLGCGAVLTSLRRTRIGEYHVNQAMTIEELENVRLVGRTDGFSRLGTV